MVFKNGSTFGEIPFLLDKEYKETAICKTFTTIYKIKRSLFLNILSLFPDDFVIKKYIYVYLYFFKGKILFN